MDTPSSSSDRDPLERLAAEFLERRRRGEIPSPSEYAEQFPQWAEQILEFFPALELMEGLKPGSRDQTTSLPATSAVAPRLERLGEYRILREIGRGGMGVVYEAVQESLGRRVALKILPLHGRIDPIQMERFQLESRSAARLHHTGIVPVHGVGDHGGVHYYAMQYIQGHGLDVILEDLRRLRAGAAALPPSANGKPENNDTGSMAIARSLLTGRFSGPRPDRAPGTLNATSTDGDIGSSSSVEAPPAAAASINSVLSLSTDSGYYRAVARLGIQVAEALAHAHGLGVLHRDIKPSNLLLDVDGHVWVTDFGLAKLEGSDGPTQTGDIIGTLRYMAPERFEGWSDRRSDLYGLGMTLYELLTLRPAFESATRAKLIDQVIHDQPPSPRKHDPRVPRDLETIVMKAIAKEPADRYATAEALAADLENFVADKPIVARRSGPLERAWRWCRRNKAAAGLLAATAVAALALVGVMVGASYNSRLKQMNTQLETTNSALAVSRKDEQAQRERAERNLYYRNILLAGRELQENHVGRVEELLEQTPAGFRGWEWNYLMRQCRAPLAKFATPSPRVGAVALSRDGQLMAASTTSGLVRVWDLSSGRIRCDLELPFAEFGLALRPDGTQLAAGGQLGAAAGTEVVRLWDLRTGKVLRDLRGHTDSILDVTFSPDGRRIASASEDGTVRVWDPDTGQPMHVLRGPCHSYSGVAFSPDGCQVFACGGTLLFGGTILPPFEITSWDAKTGRRLKGFPQNAIFCGLGLSRDGTRLAAAAMQGQVWLWDLEHDPDGRNPRILTGHTASANRVSFSPDGTRLASASDDGSIRIWDVVSGDELFILRGHHAAVQGLVFHPDGNRAVSVANDGTARLWDARTDPQSRPLLGHTQPVRGLAYALDGSRLASVGHDRTLRFWDRSSGRTIGEPVALSEPAEGLAFSPDGRQLAIACGDWSRADTPGIVDIRDAHSGGLLRRLEGHQRIAWGVAYNPRGAWLASAGGETHLPGEILLWDPGTGLRLRSLPATPEGLNSLSLHPDGNFLATGSASGTIRLWDVERGELVWARQAHIGAAQCFAFDPSGTTVLSSGSGDGRVKVLNARDGNELLSLPGHTHAVDCAIYSPDGRRLATASADGRIRLWDAATGEEVLSLRHSTVGGGCWLAFSPDGTELASGGYDGVIRLWDARPLPDSWPKSP
jgi:eukaryotic-like serine/threonine-protein kinase